MIHKTKTYRFYKEENRWYIDLPKWPLNKSYLEMVLGADDLLEYLSNNGNEIFITISTKLIKDHDDVLTKIHQQGLFNGAFYTSTKPILNNTLDKLALLWLCPVTLFVFLRYPRNIYIKIKNHDL